MPDEIPDFYDAHPYPPPVDSLESSIVGWDDGQRRRIEHLRHWPTEPFGEERAILVAGCGTSQAARWGARYPRAKVVGIDVSASSLQAQQTLIDQHGLDNVELRELPIEEVGTLAERFDQIVCTGVLHHLVDPPAGLRALKDALAPRGAVQLMVYGKYGRFGISMMREYNRRLQVRPTTVDIAGLLQVLRELPMGHPMSHVLRDTADFADHDALADALLNPRERSYTVPELFQLLDLGGVRFGRWVRQAPYRPQCGVMSGLPHESAIADMEAVDQYAAMELFRGTITRHSVVLHRDDSPLPVEPVEWSSEAWRSFIPMVPTTVVVSHDRLPPGTAAAVINTAHVDRDLICFLDRDEASAFAAVDGETSLVEISGATAGLFERLWMHDLVMIDASAK
jgi:SAM-dependent methyltransferase